MTSDATSAAHGLGGVPCLVVGDDPPALGLLLSLLLVGHRDLGRGLVLASAEADRFGVPEVVGRLRAVEVVHDPCAAAVEGIHLLGAQPRVATVGGHELEDGHERLVLGVLVVDDHVAAALVVGDRRLQGLAAGALVAGAL